MNSSWLLLAGALFSTLSLCSRNHTKNRNGKQSSVLNGRRSPKSLLNGFTTGMSFEPESLPMNIPILSSQTPSSPSHLSPLQHAVLTADEGAVDREFKRLALRKFSRFVFVAVLALFISAFMDEPKSTTNWIPSSMESRRAANIVAAAVDACVNGYGMLIPSNSPFYLTDNLTVKFLICLWFFEALPAYTLFGVFPWLIDHSIVSLLLTGAFIVMSSVIEVVIGSNIRC